MADVDKKATVIPEDNCEDAPPPYHSITSIPYAKSGSSAEATAETIVPGVEVQQADVTSDEPLSSKYSCSNPAEEIIERIARISFILILITFVGVTIASIVRIYPSNVESSYSYDADYDGSGSMVTSFLLTVFFIISLSCTIGALLCDIPVIIIQFVSTNVMNHIAFRILDIIKWILLSIGFIVIFIMVALLGVGIGSDDFLGPVITTFLVFCGITIVMGILITVWDCSHLIVTSSTRNSRPQQGVTLVPANSMQPIPITAAV